MKNVFAVFPQWPYKNTQIQYHKETKQNENKRGITRAFNART